MKPPFSGLLDNALYNMSLPTLYHSLYTAGLWVTSKAHLTVTQVPQPRAGLCRRDKACRKHLAGLPFLGDTALMTLQDAVMAF